jgi:N-acetylmuramic acid 6-phosphate etherase
MVLNMLSTGSMILLGKTYGNMMVDLQVTNEKLRERAIRIVEEATGLDRASAERALEACNHEIKTTILAEQAHLTPALARARLAAHGDRLRSALEATG